MEALCKPFSTLLEVMWSYYKYVVNGVAKYTIYYVLIVKSVDIGAKSNPFSTLLFDISVENGLSS